ncbi:membrane hypothetical protein [uncultured Mycobacterium sp.]|uniref:Transmembrane protein n=1 Tax=uncultured Mycobacterium sp. TaxID=171292 RepID=A0A1Y5P8C5_9MYCO|nr:membrane hypothetical protein [uncultured Mycobacterium sp.]
MRNLVRSTVPLADFWFLVSLAQGIEYLLRPRDSAVVLNVIEGALPLWVWGLWLVIPSLVGLVANRVPCWRFSIAAHIVCAAAYAGLAYGLIAGVIQARQIWGWQSVPAYILLLTLHGLWALVDVLRQRPYPWRIAR